MGRAPCCSKVGLRRGPWTSKEDALLTHCIQSHGEGNWRSLPQKAGLLRCGKSCRLRWMNYLRPGIKRGGIESDEEDLILRLHSLLGNRWSLIAGRLPGRTDNDIKNYWNSHLRRKLPRRLRSSSSSSSVDVVVPGIRTISCLVRTRVENKNKPAAVASGEEEDEEITAAGFRIYAPKPIRIGMIKK